ncbi:MAG: hypothetical protein JEY91_13725, partial [Spirochaetaceae bacterium]|nr:hypothetical protein [Spirochaetaceae bacterium]
MNYDSENRLRSIFDNGKNIASYNYNDVGQRIWKIEKEVVVEDNIPVEKTFKTYYFFENYEEKYDITDSDNKELIQSINYYFANGQRVAQRTNKIAESLEEVSYFHADHLGSAVRITDEDQNIIQSIAYTPFGKVAWFAGEDTTSYTYTDQEIDGSGFMYYDARYYDPELGRFLQADTYLDGMNRYTYCGNNPIIYCDPSGHCSTFPL